MISFLPQFSRWRLLGSLLAIVVITACGGGGNDGGDKGSPVPPRPSDLLIVQSSLGLTVFDTNARSERLYTQWPQDAEVGVTASMTGLIAVVWNTSTGPDPWTISVLSAADGSTVASYDITIPFSLPISAAALSPDGNQIVVGVADPTSGDYIDRLLLFDRTNGDQRFIDLGTEAVWLSNTELLVRSDNELRIVDTQGISRGIVPIEAFERDSSYSVSSDGRYIVYIGDAGAITAFDRTTGQSWIAATSIRTMYSPTLSPDGSQLALLRGGAIAGTFVHVVPFATGSTVRVEDADAVSTTNGQFILGDERMAWVPR